MALQARASRNLTSCARRRKTPRSSASIATTNRLKRIQKRIKESPGRFCISVAILQTVREHARKRLTAEYAEDRGERREILLLISLRSLRLFFANPAVSLSQADKSIFF